MYAHRKHSKRSRGEDPIVHWILRTLVRAGAARKSLRRQDKLDEGWLNAVGVTAPKDGEHAKADTLARLRARLQQVESVPPAPCLATENARLLGALLALRAVDTRLLAFAIALKTESALREAFAELGNGALPALCRNLATVIGLPLRSVTAALAADAPLRAIPLLRCTRADSSYDGPLSLASSIATVLMRPLASEAELLGQFMSQAATPQLGVEDYPHLAGDLEVIRDYLRAAVHAQAHGVNVLLYGPPGTGKTELARVLAREAAAGLHEINLEDADQDPLVGSARLHAYALCQRFLRKRRSTLLLFDEIEDVFPATACSDEVFAPRPTLTKAWINRLLESNATPAIWISNEVDAIDRAYLRRFDLALEVEEPPRAVRRRVLERQLHGLSLSASHLDRIAAIDDLSPGHVQRAAHVLRLLQPRSATEGDGVLSRVLETNLRAYRGVRRALPAPNRCEVAYDLSLLNTSVDLTAMIAGLRRTQRGSLCLYGPPGTGKSELARHIADQLGLPLHARRASDLLDKYIGETEKRLARMFARAAREGALLLLDEADSFLSDRATASHSWERSQVNELLTQMEDFGGIFVCSTNLIDRIDRATMRRFAIKLRFDPLTAAQAQRLFLATLGGDADASSIAPQLERLARMRNVTPGDFAAVTRRARILGETLTAPALLAALSGELELKGGRGGVMGFERAAR